jgi:primosomal protein N' (replication factor Y)
VTRFVDVVLASGQSPAFTYADPSGIFSPGDIARVPFGNRKALALVLECHDRAPTFPVKEAVERPLDGRWIPEHLADLVRWMADYYLCAPGAAAGPVWSCAGNSSLVRLGLGARKPPVKKTAKKELAPGSEVGIVEDAVVAPGAPPGIRPNPDQARAAERISRAVAEGGFSPFLLHGVTGSGKTETFLLAAREALSRGLQVLILVPEIGLTPQTVRRTAAFLGEPVAVLHSQLSDSDRARAWTALRDGSVRVALGPRSALFAPLFRPGLIVVDEEHDGSYKQSGDSPRYQGRDAAVWLARRCKIPVVLGSATPSLETWNNALTGRYELLELPARAAGASMPSVELVDLRASRKASGGAISPVLRQELTDVAARGEKAVVLHNRRGWAPQASCLDCGAALECPECPGLRLTWHRKSLVCHHCGHVQPPPRTCPACGSEALEPQGWAIQRVEDEIRRLLPGVPVVRLDRDTASRRGGQEKALAEFGERGGILLGTQMVAKGHDIPEVTLVGATDADIGAGMPDFRAGERTFQLLCQVSGRAGRAGLPGRVLLQTRRPEDPLLADVASHDFHGFASREIEQRRILSLPPFSRLVLVEASGTDEAATSAWIGALAASLRPRLSRAGQDAMGPMPAPIAVVARRHRFHLLCKSVPETAASLRRAVAEELARRPPPTGIRAFADVDPQDLL